MIKINENQMKELEIFFQVCQTERIDFENYQSLFARAERFVEDCIDNNIIDDCSPVMLAFGALAYSRGDFIGDILTREI